MLVVIIYLTVTEFAGLGVIKDLVFTSEECLLYYTLSVAGCPRGV